MNDKNIMLDRKQNEQNVQHHYDISDEFYSLFLDPTMTYTCAYFPRDNMTLEEAQIAKLDLSLDKCDLKPGMRLIDVGCGWGSAMIRAIEKYGVYVTGLTLSQTQYDHVNNLLREKGYQDKGKVILADWADFTEPADSVVTIGCIEHIGKSRYESYFDWLYARLPHGAHTLQHTITGYSLEDLKEKGLYLTLEEMKFGIFISKEIFPGGRLPCPSDIIDAAEKAGFEVTQIQTLGTDYAKTLDMWTENLMRNKSEAIDLVGQEKYDIYIKYLTGCSDLFTQGKIDLHQFTLLKK